MTKRATFFVFVVLMTARAAFGQDTGRGPIVSATFSVDPDTRWSVAASAGQRFTPAFSLGMELTWSRLRDLPSNFGPPYSYPSSARTNTARDLVSFTTNVRVDLHRFHRVVPFLVGGGGVVSDSLAYDVGGAAAQVVSRITDTTTFLGLVAGGGVNVLVARHVSIDGEGKFLYMKGHNGQWGRVGFGASYRF